MGRQAGKQTLLTCLGFTAARLDCLSSIICRLSACVRSSRNCAASRLSSTSEGLFDDRFLRVGWLWRSIAGWLFESMDRYHSRLDDSHMMYSQNKTKTGQNFHYCYIGWATHHTQHIELLFRKQRKAAKIMSLSKWNAQTKPLFVNHHILTVCNINIFQFYCFTYKVRYNLLPSFCLNWFKKKQWDPSSLYS